MFDDRIVVESPGKLPGLVRADNIRSTHFSRNPKIVEFLKAYSYVKEYGEGVDRMCREMSEAGLQGPQYYTNAFLLQTVVYNKEKPAFDSKKLAIQGERSAIGHKKLSIEILRSAIKKQNYNEPTIKNMVTIYDAIETDQIFGAPEVENILKCSMSTSKEIMKKLRDIEVVRSVKGKGKGKYRFVNSEEIEK